jgi:rubredoxin
MWWRNTSSDWYCPVCRRSKPEILRPDRSGDPIGHLTAHHDHFREYLDNIENERARIVGSASALDESAKRFLRRFTEGLTRFDDVVICQDCNTADAEAKKIMGAPPHLTFTPGEIGSFILPASGCVHGIDQGKLEQAYQIALDLYDVRKAAAERLADRVLKGSHWYEHVAWTDRPDIIDRDLLGDMRLLGFREGAHASTIQGLLAPPAAKITNHARWRTVRREATKAPSDTDIGYVINRHSERWNSVPDDWLCPGCGRTKQQIIRPTKQFAWVFVLAESRFVAPEVSYGEEKLVICDACNQTMKDFNNQEARADPQIAGESPYLSLADLKRLVRPQTHGLHNIDDCVARELFASLRTIRLPS